MSDRIVRIVARGLVQGVGYRAFVERRAREHAVGGWVRNRRDGTVEAVFCGPHEAVAAMIEACRHGPRHGRVDGLDVEEGTAALLGDRGSDFSVLTTV